MPRQNRVTPFGELIATPARGHWLGNRGCLHDETGRIRRLYQTRRWITCVLAWKGTRRRLMQPGRWTELFFLDEATALAAGHRPCAYCQRAKYEAFRALWAAVNPDLAGSPQPSAETLDAALHAERLDARRQRVTYPERFAALPDAAFVVYEGRACLVHRGRLRHWQPEGYDGEYQVPPNLELAVLTPRSVVRVLAAGWAVERHGSAG